MVAWNGKLIIDNLMVIGSKECIAEILVVGFQGCKCESISCCINIAMEQRMYLCELNWLIGFNPMDCRTVGDVAPILIS